MSEGFTRQCVADSIHASSDDYISILRELGSECLGAIQIIDEDKTTVKAGFTEVQSMAEKILGKILR